MMARMSPARSALWLSRFATFTLMLTLLSFAGCMGCGDEEIEVDPTMDEIGTGDGLEDVTMEEDPFGGAGSPTDQTDTEGDDLEAAPLLALEDVFFAYDQYDLDAESRAVLARNARLMREEPQVRVLIEGHCDERGTVQYNLALGEKRANEAKRHLVSLGIDANRIDTVSYGKERPFVEGMGESVWSQNRRAHFVVRGASR